MNLLIHILISAFCLNGGASTEQLKDTYAIPQDTTKKVEAYDLRGKGYTDQQVGATALEHSKTKLVVVAFADTSNHKYQEDVLLIVKCQMALGRKKIMVLFADKGKAQTFSVLFAKNNMLPGMILEKDDPGGLELTIAIRVTYDIQFGKP
ncbi:hypothetical protein QQ054_36400 [Oscillatoria amoena NRMC-F 0135]|nr:hypothetical protein [Oscillatoria amoena NRMC-F 0135]